MILKNRQWLAENAAEAWLKQYPEDRDGCAEKIRQLGPSPNPDDVDRIIGNSSWTNLRCDECDKQVDAVMVVGDEPDYDSATASICRECASNVLGWFDKGVAGFVFRAYRKKD